MGGEVVSQAMGVHARLLAHSMGIEANVAAAWTQRFAEKFGDDAVEEICEAAGKFRHGTGMPANEAMRAAEKVATSSGADAVHGVARLTNQIRRITGEPVPQLIVRAEHLSSVFGGPGVAKALSLKLHTRATNMTGASLRDDWEAQIAWAEHLAERHGADEAIQIMDLASFSHPYRTPVQLRTSMERTTREIEGASGTPVGRLHEEFGMTWREAWELDAARYYGLETGAIADFSRTLVARTGVPPREAVGHAVPLLHADSTRAEGAAAALDTFDALRAGLPDVPSADLLTTVGRVVANGIPTDRVLALAKRLDLLGDETARQAQAVDLLEGFGPAGDVVADIALGLHADVGLELPVALERAYGAARRLGPEHAREVARAHTDFLTTRDGGDLSAALLWATPDHFRKTARQHREAVDAAWHQLAGSGEWKRKGLTLAGALRVRPEVVIADLTAAKQKLQGLAAQFEMNWDGIVESGHVGTMLNARARVEAVGNWLDTQLFRARMAEERGDTTMALNVKSLHLGDVVAYLHGDVERAADVLTEQMRVRTKLPEVAW